MSKLLQLLRDEAVTLLDPNLPSQNEVRPILGALIGRLERLEQDLVGELKAPPAADDQPPQQSYETAYEPPASAEGTANVTQVAQPAPVPASVSAAPVSGGSVSDPSAAYAPVPDAPTVATPEAAASASDETLERVLAELADARAELAQLRSERDAQAPADEADQA